MTNNDFIFSDHPLHRIARHVIFWAIWWLSYLVLYHYPVHSFKGWNLDEASLTFQKLGAAKFFLKTLVFNALLPVILPQAAFTYCLLYWILPRYFFKKRDPFVTIAVLVVALMIYFVLALGFKFITPLYNYYAGLTKEPPQFDGLGYAVIRDQLTTLPIVAGFALMIKLVKRWWMKQQQTRQLTDAKAKAELQLLKAQIHPHFLFNTLNNIYFFTLTFSPQAPEMIKKLSDMLNYILNECNQSVVPLEKEIKMIQDYMALEKIRYGDQINMNIETSGNYTNRMIAPLLLIPFVENSFKHGASKMLENSYVKLRITIEDTLLHFTIINSLPPAMETVSAKGNIGLKNVRQRLQLLYPDDHELHIVSEPDNFTVILKLELREMTSPLSDNKSKKSTAAYAMA